MLTYSRADFPSDVIAGLSVAAVALPVGVAYAQHGATSSKIEDFFDPTIKDTVLGGKTFNDNNNFDITKHYGKRIFAEQVVQAKAHSIDFSGFRPLLAVVESVVKAHKAAFTGIAAGHGE